MKRPNDASTKRVSQPLDEPDDVPPGRFLELPGRGTTFDILLPVTVIQTEETPEKQGAGPIPRGIENVLIVDDDRSIAAMSRKTFEQLGYTVTAVTSSLDALAIFEKDPEGFDLVITDMTMPKMTGAALAEKILNRRPDLPIILCTGYSELITEEKAMKIGIRSFFMKPVSQKDLARTARRLLNEHCRN